MMAKKTKQSVPGSLRISLYDPGMTPVHRAGLGGLAATLASIPKRLDLGTWEVDGDSVTLSWDESPDALLEYIFSRGLRISEEGIVDFPALHDRLGSRPSFEARLLHQEALMGTMLQHGSTRKKGPERRLVLDPDVHSEPKLYEPLLSFKHQEQAAAITKALKKKKASYVRIVGSALPGAVERHPGKSWSRMEVSPAHFLALCFALVGSFSFRVRNALYGKARAFALVTPVVDDLDVFRKLRRKLNNLTSEQLHVSSASDAALLVATALNPGVERSKREAYELFCSVMVFGIQPWAKQQKTRTQVLYVDQPDDRVLSLYRAAMEIPAFQTKRVKSKDGGYFYAPSLMRAAMTEAIVEGKPWWKGVAEAFIGANASTRQKMDYEQRGLREMTQVPDAFDQKYEKIFVHVCHDAMRQIYGWIHHEFGDLRTSTAAQNKARSEITKIRSSLLRAKNAETLQDALLDFWSRAARSKVRANVVLKKKHTIKRKREGSSEEQEAQVPGWEAILPMLADDSWRKARNLALVALLSYSSSHQPDEDDADATLDDDSRDEQES